MYEVLGVVALTAVYVIWRHWWKVRRLRTSADWPVADGYVAQIEEKRDDNGSLVVTLAYTYKVADERYVGREVRNLPISARCKVELLRWRDRLGPNVSPFVFPNMRTLNQPLKDIRRSWSKTLRSAKLDYFWIYNLRHTFASRLSAAGLSDLFVAQMMGHSTPSILQTYAKVVDEYRRSAIQKLETLRIAHAATKKSVSASIN
jgi:integrase